MIRQKVRKVLCPLCGTGRIVDVPVAVDTSRWKLFSAEKPAQAELYLKCPVCKKQIGLAIQR